MARIFNKDGPDVDVGFSAVRQPRDGIVRQPRDGIEKTPHNGFFEIPREGIDISSSSKRRTYAPGEPDFGTGNGRIMPERQGKSQKSKCKWQMAK
jgi:hypothetical protein